MSSLCKTEEKTKFYMVSVFQFTTAQKNEGYREIYFVNVNKSAVMGCFAKIVNGF